MRDQKEIDQKTFYLYTDSPLGKLLIARTDAGLAGIWFEGQKYEATPQMGWQEKVDDPLLQKAASQLRQYFDGELKKFTVNFALEGTEFQQSVWQELLQIPHGETITYGELANRLGKPSAVRAAAAAVGRNPASVIVPCHRVIGANGSLTGYAGGLERKQKLLLLEQAESFALT